MKFLKQLADEAPITEAKSKKTDKRGKPHDGIHDDGTKLQFDKDGPFKGKKFSQFIGNNMFMPVADNGDMSGTMESVEIVAEGKEHQTSPDTKSSAKVLNDVLMSKRGATHRDKKNDYKRGENKLNLKNVISEGLPQKNYKYEARTEIRNAEDKPLEVKVNKGTVQAASRDEARQKVLNAHRRAYKVDVSESVVTESPKHRLISVSRQD